MASNSRFNKSFGKGNRKAPGDKFIGKRRESSDNSRRERPGEGRRPYRKRIGSSDKGIEKPWNRPGRPAGDDSRSFGKRPVRSGGQPWKKTGYQKPGEPGVERKSGYRKFGDKQKRFGGSEKRAFESKRTEGFSGGKRISDHRDFSDRPKRFSARPKRDYPPKRQGETPGEKRFSRPRYEKKSFVRSRLEKQRETKPQQEKGVLTFSDQGLTRLNKFIANSGVCSRREADERIKMGLVTVNGKSVTEMGFKVKVGDEVRYEGKRLTAEKPVYILLNKPKGFLTTTDDPQERNTVMSIIESACKERVYPVGRLDRNTTGLLLFTNDGELAEKLTHPSYNVKKIYKAELDKPLAAADFEKIKDGVSLEEGRAMVDDLAIVSDDSKTVGIELHIGWNRIVRRIFEAVGYVVTRLDRVVYAGLDKKELPRGKWRFLKQEEIVRLKHYK